MAATIMPGEGKRDTLDSRITIFQREYSAEQGNSAARRHVSLGRRIAQYGLAFSLAAAGAMLSGCAADLNPYDDAIIVPQITQVPETAQNPPAAQPAQALLDVDTYCNYKALDIESITFNTVKYPVVKQSWDKLFNKNQPDSWFPWVSTEPNEVTLACIGTRAGIIGVAGHNYLNYGISVGKHANYVNENQNVFFLMHVNYRNGRVETYKLTKTYFFQNLEPGNPASDYRLLNRMPDGKFEVQKDNGKEIIYDANRIAKDIYSHPLVIQTCIENWGTLFITGEFVSSTGPERPFAVVDNSNLPIPMKPQPTPAPAAIPPEQQSGPKDGAVLILPGQGPSQALGEYWYNGAVLDPGTGTCRALSDWYNLSAMEQNMMWTAGRSAFYSFDACLEAQATSIAPLDPYVEAELNRGEWERIAKRNLPRKNLYKFRSNGSEKLSKIKIYNLF